MSLTFVHGDKGGVGKSFMTKSIIDHCLRRTIPVVAVDADTRNADVYQIFGPLMRVERFNLRTEEGWSDLAELMATEHDKSQVVVNLPAGIGEEEERFGGVFAEAANHVGTAIKTIWMLNNETESIKPLRHMLDRNGYAGCGSMLAVRNHHFGRNFALWENSHTRAEFLKHGGTEADFPSLSPTVVELLVRDNLSFGNAVTSGKMKLYERIVLETWLRSVDEMLSSASVLGFSPAA